MVMRVFLLEILGARVVPYTEAGASSGERASDKLGIAIRGRREKEEVRAVGPREEGSLVRASTLRHRQRSHVGRNLH